MKGAAGGSGIASDPPGGGHDVMSEGRHELGRYRGYRLFAVEDRGSFRGYALKTSVLPDGTTSQDAFTAAAPTLPLLVELLRDSVDDEAEHGGG